MAVYTLTYVHHHLCQHIHYVEQPVLRRQRDTLDADVRVSQRTVAAVGACAPNPLEG